ncbi:Na+/H+ antiporter NhaC family protein [Nesterenkonia massiliensis]|uniref:Na+/H+ antiporter NhaC family protein n=1 Tax=Nesterenkonia massiliensis TaxID=1232429 RepID=A0ABT2HS56_9MICC|nr:Na+/H+ antiporter NhaC family protein [Nesterenkonia massiliensis]MCT1607523.1 Na+/H+ antiporter NhaC family protein [Nesterenkonia massiliensis]
MSDLATSYPLLTLVPPVLALTLVILTRKVLISLGAGVVAAALLIHDLNPLSTVQAVWNAFASIFWADGEVNTWSVYILVFLLMLGVIAAFILMSGGTTAFALWAMRRIQKRPGSMFLPAILGIVIFIDDYFNALAVGQISRPVTDQHRVSRAKLAYIIDSTSAPVSVLSPVSSWGAYIMGILAPIVAASTLSISSVQAFLGAAVANYYAIAAAVLVWLVIIFRIDMGAMRKEERRAITEGQPFDPSDDVPGQLSDDLPVHDPGARRALIVPFVLLVVGVFAGIVWTGQRAAESWNIIDILAETDASAALVVGGLLGLISAVYYYLRNTRKNPQFVGSTFARGWVEGVKSMLPAIAILIPAWMLGDLIGQLGTGDYLGQLVEASNISAGWLAPVVFVIAAAMSFATGTSWGSFGLLLPIAGGIINSMDQPDLLLPVLGAVLAGAVAGDHASPISDTTILSATGSSCNVITHVVTQLPYVASAAVCATLGYVALALTSSVVIGLVVVAAGLAAFVVIMKATTTPIESAQTV